MEKFYYYHAVKASASVLSFRGEHVVEISSAVSHENYQKLQQTGAEAAAQTLRVAILVQRLVS